MTLTSDEFAYTDPEGNTLTAWIGQDGRRYLASYLADQETSVTTQLSGEAADNLSRFLARRT
ncbi:hypothetical protein [Mycolicibacterium sp.]|uniref:hypothetical protein n=1 Tax=Mycolicibacterium sp. TaxID=2320850 RepID=UPI0037C635CD